MIDSRKEILKTLHATPVVLRALVRGISPKLRRRVA
jgi:hypothetical protein